MARLGFIASPQGGAISLLVLTGLLVLFGSWTASAPLLRRRRAISILVVASLSALCHAVALVVLRHPVGSSAVYAAGIDPTSAVGAAYWVSLAGLVAALAGGTLALLSERDTPAGTLLLAWPGIVGAAAGVVFGTVTASAVLDGRQDATRRVVELLATDGPGPAAFGPDLISAAATASPGSTSRGNVTGDTEGLYSGESGRTSCDRNGLATAVTTTSRGRAEAWSYAVAIAAREPSSLTDVGRYVSGLTPVQLRADTRVTAHRFDGDRAVPYQATLQTGTGVLIDELGVPRVRCAGGTPLAQPHSNSSGPQYLGAPWPGFDPAALVTVTPASGSVHQFGLIGDGGAAFRRPAGTTGNRDVDQVPARALLDGAYLLRGQQSSCTLNDCAENENLDLEVNVLGCPEQCRITSAEWDAALKVTHIGRLWSFFGAVVEEESFSCKGDLLPTTFTFDLRVVTGQVVNQLWTADQVEGEYRKTSPTDAVCNEGVLSWDVSGALR